MKVLKADCGGGDAYIDIDLSAVEPAAWFLQADFWIPAATFTALNLDQFSAQWLWIGHTSGVIDDSIFLTGWDTGGVSHAFSSGNRNYWTNSSSGNPVSSSFTPDAWHTVAVEWDGSTAVFKVDGATLFSYSENFPYLRLRVGGVGSNSTASEIYYVDNVRVGTASGLSDVFNENFEDGTFDAWDSTTGSVSVIDDPLGTGGPSGGGTTPPPPVVAGRVGIAFDDGPLEPSPTWTFIDQGGAFPQNFVSGYDIQSGRQTLLSQTDTGTAVVYLNDHKLALFDPRNTLSPYFGKLDGKQIRLQLYDPEAAAWEDQFRGLIDDISWEIDGSAVGADGQPINASIQIECVDMFDYLAGFGLTPGLDGVTPRPLQPPSPPRTAGGPPPAGYEDGVYYAQTTGTVDDRIIEILADAHIDSTRYTVASGNVSVKAVKYDPDESALQALRDAADAELPFIANIYCDRHGDFLFRGRYSSFDPDATAAEPGSTWDFQRWAAGDGAAIVADSTRAQIRTFAFGRNRSDLINVAICYPQGMKPAQMPNQVHADATSITDFGKHSAPPMSDLLTNEGSTSGSGFTTTDVQECYLFAKLTVLNQKDPRENIKTLGFKAIRPDGSDRSVRTWALITRSDISHIVNVAVGYPSGTGLDGASPLDDYYIQGRKMQVRPLNPDHDYVELDLNVTPAVWSMDTNGVFPAFPGAGAPTLTADFTSAE